MTANNFIKKSDSSFTVVGSTKRSCTAPRAALNGHFPGASGAYNLATVSHDLSLYEKDKRWFGGDVNGDGVGDLLNIYKASDGRWRVWIHVGMGRAFGHRSSLQRLDVKKKGEWLVANFDGEGGDDLVFIFEENGSLFANTWLDDGIGFSPSGPTNVGGKSPLGPKPAGISRWLAGDFDGDGKADLAQVIDEQGDARVLTHRSVGGQFFQASYSSQVLGAFVEAHRWLSGDFDGDGTHDLVLVFKNSAGKANALVRLGTGSGFENFSWLQYISTNGSASGAAGFWDSQRWLVTNFDGDSRDDLILVYNSDRRNRVWRSRSTGSTFAHGGIQTLGLYYDDKVWLSSPASSGRDGLLVIGTQRTRRPGGGGIEVLPQLPAEVGPLAPVGEPEEKPTPDVRPTATTTPPATLAPEDRIGPRFLDRSINEIRDSKVD